MDGRIGKPHRLFLSVEAHDTKHRTEHFLACKLHCLGHVLEDCRRHVAAAGLGEDALAAGEEAGALRRGLGDKAEILGQLFGARHRADIARQIERIADLQLCGRLEQFVQEAVIDRGLDQQARAGDADLSGIAEDAVGRHYRRLMQIRRIGKDDVGRLAAKLEEDALEIGAGGIFEQAATNRTGAGEGDGVNIHVQAESLAGSLAATVTTLKTPSGRPASEASSASRSKVSDAISGGLTTMELPAAKAGAIFQAPIISGKFHGTMIPTTPSGSFWIKPSTLSAVGAISP